METIYKILEANQKKRMPFEKSQEHNFFVTHRSLLMKFPRFRFFYDTELDFNIFRANIIINGLLNKKMFEEEIAVIQMHKEHGEFISDQEFVNALKDCVIDQPYYTQNDIKIYMPFFSKVINLLYQNEPMKLFLHPYKELITTFESSLVDPFDTYGAELFNSYFTRLVKVGTNGKEIAYFHYDFNTVYIVNSQGRLDCKIVLFDKYIKHIDSRYMLERLQPLMEAFFSNNRELFVENLFKNRFISQKLYEKLK